MIISSGPEMDVLQGTLRSSVLKRARGALSQRFRRSPDLKIAPAFFSTPQQMLHLHDPKWLPQRRFTIRCSTP